MKATCPNNKKHKKFLTTAHVMQEWEVDNTGEFRKITVDCLQITHQPDIDNQWICKTCGALAIVEDD